MNLEQVHTTIEEFAEELNANFACVRQNLQSLAWGDKLAAVDALTACATLSTSASGLLEALALYIAQSQK